MDNTKPKEIRGVFDFFNYSTNRSVDICHNTRYTATMKISGKDDIRTTALDIIAYEGIDKLTMSYLASELGITKATLYHWYKAKDEILDDIYTEGHRSLMKKGFKLSLKGTMEEVLLEAVSNWEALFSSDETSPYLRMIFSLHFTDERAKDEYTSLILMMKSQADVIMEALGIKLGSNNKKMLSKLFSSLLLSSLEKMINEEENTIKEDTLSYAHFLESL